MDFIWFKGKQEGWADAYGVRVAVFIDEQGFSAGSEDEELDGACWHVLAKDGGTAGGTARIFPAGAPGEWHIGRMAVMPAYRGQGLGRAIMQHAMQKAAELGASRIVLGAQQDKTGFYESLGFVSTGREFYDEFCPHVDMAYDIPLG